MTDDPDLQDRLKQLEEAFGTKAPDGPTEIVITDKVVEEGHYGTKETGVARKQRIYWEPGEGWTSEVLVTLEEGDWEPTEEDYSGGLDQ